MSDVLQPHQFIPVSQVDTDMYGAYDDPEDPVPESTRANVERLSARYREGQPVDPIHVREGSSAFGKYEIVDGWHRTHAARLAGLTHIAARVKSRKS